MTVYGMRDERLRELNRPLFSMPTWELNLQRKALSFFSVFNTKADSKRLADVQRELKIRRQKGNQ